MSLNRHDPADCPPPWGDTVRIEDVFDLPERGTVLQVKAWVPGTACLVRLNPSNRGAIETTAIIDRPIGDHIQAALLVKGYTASDFSVGDEIEFIAGDVR